MKVSRKAGRRSRSSVSRRRLRNKKSRSGYRKKHTQRGGKYGKRSRGHKRARTHKRGKRFHRGGKLITFFTKPGPISFDEKTGKIKNIIYTKITPGEGPSDRFDNFDIKVNPTLQGITIVFSRPRSENKRSLEFTFGPETLLTSVMDIMTRSFTAGNTITNSSDASDDAKYQLNLDDEKVVMFIKQYIHDKVFETTAKKQKPAVSVNDFFSDKIAAENDAAAESTP